jgi:hypothetical protein
LGIAVVMLGSAIGSFPGHTTNLSFRTSMGEALTEAGAAGYVYNLTKASTDWPTYPHPTGTEMNCEAAAHLLKWLAEKRGIQGGLRSRNYPAGIVRV